MSYTFDGQKCDGCGKVTEKDTLPDTWSYTGVAVNSNEFDGIEAHICGDCEKSDVKENYGDDE